MHGMVEWTSQLNTYAGCTGGGILGEELRIIALRDCQSSQARRHLSPGAVVTVDIPLWTEAEQFTYIGTDGVIESQQDAGRPVRSARMRSGGRGRRNRRGATGIISVEVCNQRQAELGEGGCPGRRAEAKAGGRGAGGTRRHVR
jgi:hypothetical protein